MILNSLSCVLSYNYYDYKALLKDGKKKVLHESTLVRQSLYYSAFFGVLLSLTLEIDKLNPTNVISLVDQYGNNTVVEATFFCSVLLGVGWGSFILSWIINICFYAIHPSKGNRE